MLVVTVAVWVCAASIGTALASMPVFTEQTFFLCLSVWFVLFLQCCEGHSSANCVPQLRTMRPVVRTFLLIESVYRFSQTGPRAIFRGQSPEMPPLAWSALVEIKAWPFQAYGSQWGQ